MPYYLFIIIAVIIRFREIIRHEILGGIGGDL